MGQSNANLLAKHRPTTLADVLGQGWVVQNLDDFVRAPYPVAFLFEGETGTGKTSAALALANDLGCAPEEGQLGGVHEIPSGEQTADSVRQILRRLALRPPCGSGWKVLIVNEADRMSTAAETVWLDGLEQLPPKSVIVFTTNHVGRLSQRFLDRCERFEFESRGHVLRADLQALVKRVWKAETGSDVYPLLEELGEVEDDDGCASFRRALQLLTPHVRARTIFTRATRPICDNYGRPVNGTKHPLSTRVFDILKRSPKPLHRAEIHKAINRTRSEPVKMKTVSATLSAFRRRGIAQSFERGFWSLA